MKPSWYLLDGALKYLRCRRNKKPERREYLRKCKACPSAKFGRVPALGYALYCGEPLKDRMKEELPTCGCPVGFVRAGMVERAGAFKGMPNEDVKRIALAILKPAGRSTCADYGCPQKR